MYKVAGHFASYCPNRTEPIDQMDTSNSSTPLDLTVDDPLHWVRFLSITIFNNKFYRWARIFTLIFQIVNLITDIYFFVMVFEAAYLYRYLAVFLSQISAVLFGIGLLWSEKLFKCLDKEFWSMLWSIDTATIKTKRKIQTDFKYITATVVVNTLLGVGAGFMLIPTRTEQMYQLALVLFRNYFPTYHYILDFFYFLLFPITSYMIINVANMIAYYVYLGKSQIHLGLDVISHMSVDYNDYDEDTLLHSAEYQRVIKRRMAFIVIRHNELLRISRIATNLASQLLPWFVIGGIVMFLSALSNWYLVEVNIGYWLYVKNFCWLSTSTLTGALLVHCGQEIEDLTGAMFSVVNDVPWTSFNTSNKRTMLTILTVAQIPVKLQFTETVSLNYQLGIRMLRNVYSFAALFASVKSTN
ncbi:hypothetical protein Zmor_011403 [Zophobas morio]|uniref:Odorant receptor n=1 Tax=Zophobas morio TaxID=2755281 RepID=A0AA38IV28_9CUCU|nr:hypothetical protein Zmor_011403 [Zophobas morio]